MTMQEYVLTQLQKVLKKYGFTDEELATMAGDYTYNVLEQYPPDEMPIDVKGFLDERLPDLIGDIIKGNVFKYPLIDEDYELRFVLETTLTRGEVDAVLRAYREEETELEFTKFLEGEGIVAVGGFEKAIEY